MIDDLYNVDWSQFHSSIDIPGWILNWASPNPEAFPYPEAYEYDIPLKAWPLVIPFLFQILQLADAPNKGTILGSTLFAPEFPDVDEVVALKEEGQCIDLSLVDAMHESFLRGLPIFFRLLDELVNSDSLLHTNVNSAVSLSKCCSISSQRLEKVLVAWLDAISMVNLELLPFYVDVLLIRAFNILPERIATFYQPKDPGKFSPLQKMILHKVTELDPVWNAQYEIKGLGSIFWDYYNRESAQDPYYPFYFVQIRMVQMDLPSSREGLVKLLKKWA